MIEARKNFFVGYPAFAVGEFFCFADVGSESFNMGQIGVENFADKRIELAMPRACKVGKPLFEDGRYVNRHSFKSMPPDAAGQPDQHRT